MLRSQPQAFCLDWLAFRRNLVIIGTYREAMLARQQPMLQTAFKMTYMKYQG